MAIADTISSMYENVGEVYDTITNVDLPTNKNIENIPSTIRKSYLNIMNNGYQDIYDNWEKVSGTGTSLTLNNTEEAPMTIEYKGNTSQGENPTPTSPQDIHVVSGDNSINVCGKNLLKPYQLSGSHTANGLTATMQSNGTMLVNGTATGNTWIEFVKTFGNTSETTKILYPLDTTKTYIQSSTVISGTISGTANFSIQVNTNVNSSTSVGATRQITGANGVYRAWLYIRNGAVLTNAVIGFQLEEGTTASPYEANQGNTYNIDLPVENLFDKYKEKDNFFYNSSGTTTVSSGNYFINQEIPLNNTYTISYSNRVNGGGIYSFIRFVEYGANDSFIKRTQLENNNSSITLDTNTKKVIISVDAGPNAYFEDLQIEKGSKANSYTPYGTTPIELCKIGTYQDRIFKSSGKNLFDKDSISNGFLDESGIVGGDTSAYRTSDFIPILPNTAYYKTTTSSPRTKYYDKNKQPLNTTTYWDIPIGGNAGTFTPPSNAYYFRFSYPVAGVNANSIMINKGTTALDYEPYGTSWYLNKKIGKVVLNGSEDWNADAGTQGTDYRHNILRSRLDIPNPIGINGTYMSNYFRQHTMNNDSGFFGEFYCNSNWFIFLDKEKQYLIEGWKDWLSTHNTEVYYVLATPTYTEITDSTLLSQLEALNGARSYTTQTNISQVNNDKPFILDATALKELSQ